MSPGYKAVDVACLLGETLSNVKRAPSGDWIYFFTTSGRKFRMLHRKDCCERVVIEDICGDLEDLVGQPLLMAEEVSRRAESSEVADDEWEGSGTWTFYKFATIKGYVTIRWLGLSNGYYSEAVDFEEEVEIAETATKPITEAPSDRLHQAIYGTGIGHDLSANVIKCSTIVGTVVADTSVRFDSITEPPRSPMEEMMQKEQAKTRSIWDRLLGRK